MASIIKNRAVIDDAWQVVRAAEDGTLPAVDALPAGKVLVPFALWQAGRAALVAAKT
ncbi:oxidoreductase, partial [Burkholderia orbicola]